MSSDAEGRDSLRMGCLVNLRCTASWCHTQWSGRAQINQSLILLFTLQITSVSHNFLPKPWKSTKEQKLLAPFFLKHPGALPTFRSVSSSLHRAIIGCCHFCTISTWGLTFHMFSFNRELMVQLLYRTGVLSPGEDRDLGSHRLSSIWILGGFQTCLKVLNHLKCYYPTLSNPQGLQPSQLLAT